MPDRNSVQEHTIVSDDDIHAWARKALQRALHVERTTTRPQIAADAMGHLSVIARNAADGRIDHTEEAETAEAADQIIATVLPLSSAGKR